MKTVGSLSYRTYIQREFISRKRHNPGYSLRAFARDLGIPAPKLSQALRGVRGISGERALQIARRMQLTQEESAFFVSLVESEHSRSKAGRMEAQEAVRVMTASQGFDELSLERFKIISDWYHTAILELSEVEGFRSDPTWIARTIGITVDEARTAIERLIDFGLFERTPESLKATHRDLATPSGVPSRAIRDHHQQILQKAAGVLEEVPVEERDFSAITMAIPSDQMEEARKWLREFRRKFCKDLQGSGTKDRVYCLAIQFFPLDKGRKGQKK